MKGFIAGFLLAATLFTGGFFAYTRWISRSSGRDAAEVSARYHCPMHPTYVSDRPGDCPICGMRLVPIAEPEQEVVEANEPAMASEPMNGSHAAPVVPGYASVKISPERLQMMGITLAEARRIDLDQSIRTSGRVTYDETRVHHVHTKFDGFIEDLYVNFVGQFVKKGQPLFSIYSPELYATQNEYLLALRAQEQIPMMDETGGRAVAGRIDLVASARQRLALWDIGQDQIRELEKSRTPVRALTIYSPVSGYVTGKMALQGKRVMSGDNLYDIVDLSSVWVQADLYAVTLPFVRLGQPATLTLPYQPGKTWRARVSFIDPTVDPASRTVRARLEIANPNGELKPDMYADVVIGGSRGRGIVIPESAVIATGERNVVFIARDDGVFEPREVVLGVQMRDLCEIREGIVEGEKVVTGANFLLDAESKLKAAISGSSGTDERDHQDH